MTDNEQLTVKKLTEELPSISDVMKSLVKAKDLLNMYIGGMYLNDIEEFVDEVNQEKLERSKLIRAQRRLLGVIKDCQFHDMDCLCGHCDVKGYKWKQ